MRYLKIGSRWVWPPKWKCRPGLGHLDLVFIDRFTRNYLGDDSEREALIQLTLNEPIDSREIVIEVNCP